MEDFYNAILEDGRMEYFKVETKIKDEHCIYNFINTDNIAKFIYEIFRKNNTVISYDSILEQLEETEEYHFFDNDIEISCSLTLMIFVG